MIGSPVPLRDKYRVLTFRSFSEANGMDQETPAGEEELAVLALYKTLRQCTGRWDHNLDMTGGSPKLVGDSMKKAFC